MSILLQCKHFIYSTVTILYITPLSIGSSLVANIVVIIENESRFNQEYLLLKQNLVRYYWCLNTFLLLNNADHFK